MSKAINSTRRRLIRSALYGGAAVTGLGLAYSLKRGIRYPTLGLEPTPLPSTFHFESGTVSVDSDDLIRLDAGQQQLRLRAFSVQPAMLIRNQDATRIKLSVNNIAAEAELQLADTGAASLVSETVDGITRTLTLDLKPRTEINLRWTVPYKSNYSFAAIGDSGGDQELAWCLQRAHDLGAKFLLHLGDFNYQDSDYDRAVELFHNSPIPCFISIGNHDFHDSGLLYPQFLAQLGPLNHAFTIGKTRFVNIDTAASMFPYSAGKRGKLLQSLTKFNASVADTVSFTHRPLHDPIEGSTHDIGNTGERNWLIDMLKRIDSPTLISGHIHIYHRSDFMGIDNIIAGQGLGHQDILTNSDYSKIVLGNVDDDGKVSFSAEPLSMPMGLHCHPRSQSARDSLSDIPGTEALAELLKQSCT